MFLPIWQIVFNRISGSLFRDDPTTQPVVSRSTRTFSSHSLVTTRSAKGPIYREQEPDGRVTRHKLYCRAFKVEALQRENHKNFMGSHAP